MGQAVIGGQIMNQQAFIIKLSDILRAENREIRVLNSLILAQGMLESSFGNSELAKKANNLFGVKGIGDAGKYTINTREFINGKDIIVKADFRKYSSWNSCVKEQVKRFTENPRYSKLVGEKDYKKACTLVWEAGYATDPEYPAKLIRIIEAYELYKYDRSDDMAQMGTVPVQIRALDRLHPKVKVMAEMLINEAKKANIPIIVTETLRTTETQREYYSWGRTKINPHTRKMTVVTNLDGVNKRSRHQTGLAFDICINIRGREWDVALLNRVGKIGADLGLTWGGNWKTFVDRPHYEIPPNQIDSFIIPKEDDELIEKTTIKINGKEVQVERIFKDNRNYIKLDDLRAHGLDVMWDPIKKIPVINIK